MRADLIRADHGGMLDAVQAGWRIGPIGCF
jgi:hypothetical protein